MEESPRIGAVVTTDDGFTALKLAIAMSIFGCGMQYSRHHHGMQNLATVAQCRY